jgi:serine/threonine protein kinase/tetratricopeptide (TPR) repeat protein
VTSSDEQLTAPAGEPLPDLPFDTRTGPYRLIRELGHGGMGTVYLAVRDDDAFQKRVAIKVLKRGMDTEAIVRRFRHERQILASLEHPHIASLLDGGTTRDGRPYFAMEYVEGQPITDYCDARQLDTTARLDLFRKVCAAIQYAHQNLIIHRDIKPANVLVMDDGTPKLLDFGIAKLLNPELGGHTLAPTVAGLHLMTPEYASPEQVRGETVTTATDVYSLGVLLYELLTGRRPYRITSRAPADVARVISESTPARPSTAVTEVDEEAAQRPQSSRSGPGKAVTGDRPPAGDGHRLRRRLAGDLDNIVLKALSKEPSRRYASVDQFSEDLRRHLAGLPVIARKDTLGYRTAKFVGRHRAAVVAGILTFLALVAGTIGTAWQASAARAERLRAEQRFDDVRRLANSLLFELHDEIRDLPGSTPARKLLVTKALEYLDKLLRESGDRPDLTRELAAAYLKVGDVQGRPFNPNLGDTGGALESYRKATALYEARAASAGSSDPTLQRERSTAYMRLGELLSSAGDTAGALAMARKGLALHSRTSSGLSDPDARRALAASTSRVGDLLSATGDVRGALEHRRTSLALMQTVAATAPDNADNLRQLGVAHQKLGNTLGNPNAPNVGDFSGALDQLDQSAAVFRRAAKLHPSNALFRRNLAVAYSNGADVLLALKRPEAALARIREAFVEFKALADADPSNAAARNDLAICHSKLGEMLDALGRPAEAIGHYEQGLAMHQSLAAADPNNVSFKAEVASSHNRLATAQAKVGARALSLSNHGRAVAMSRELTAANPADVELRMAIALALTGRGDAYAGFARDRVAGSTPADDLAAAERDYVEAVEILSSLQQGRALEGSDLATVENARKELARIRAERKK